MNPPLFVRIVLGLSAVTFGALGLCFLVDPVGWAAVVELQPGSPLAVSDIRTVYGGLELGLALGIGIGVVRPSLAHASLLVHNAAWGGLALGRVLSLGIAAPPGSYSWLLLGSEAFGLLLGVAAWRSMRASAADPR